MAARSLAAVVERRVGVAEFHVGGGPGLVLTLLLFFGVVLGDRERDQPVGDDRAEGAVGAGGEALVDPAGADQGQGVGLLGDPAGLPGRHLQPDEAFPQQREAVA